MKRIKMMLLSLALFAVVGAALAFKARFTDTFCTAIPNGTGIHACDAKACSIFTDQVVIGQTGTAVCTAPYDDNNCQTPPPCVQQAPVLIDRNDVGK